MRLNTVVEIYKEPSISSKVIQKIYWDNLKNYNNLKQYSEDEVFLAYVPKNNYAFLSVLDETDDNWYQVCFNQKTGETGWIKQDENAKFYSWPEFMIKFGKDKGAYIFKDVKSRNLYARPDDTSPVIDSWKWEKNVQPYFVNGNWLIVKILDYNNQLKTGYIRWRETDGRLLIFANLRK